MWKWYTSDIYLHTVWHSVTSWSRDFCIFAEIFGKGTGKKNQPPPHSVVWGHRILQIYSLSITQLCMKHKTYCDKEISRVLNTHCWLSLGQGSSFPKKSKLFHSSKPPACLRNFLWDERPTWNCSISSLQGEIEVILQDISSFFICVCDNCLSTKITGMHRTRIYVFSIFIT